MSAIAPDLSHYYGRACEAIQDGTGAEGDPVWTLVLEGGIAVHNYDAKLPKPGDHFVGQRFTNMTLHPRVTSMFFGGLGGNTVSLNPMKYAIGGAGTETPYYPQVSEAQETWQPPPPAPEVATGPDADWHADQARQQAEREAEQERLAAAEAEADEPEE